VASRAVAEALAHAGRPAPDWIYASASGDAPRDAWESRVLSAALGARRVPTVSLGALVGHHAGLGALHVAAAAWTARAGRLPDTGGGTEPTGGLGLVHGLGRGGGHVALTVEAA
jgi:3-oxoacyl-(acyl-carrier-protein) synthase